MKLIFLVSFSVADPARLAAGLANAPGVIAGTRPEAVAARYRDLYAAAIGRVASSRTPSMTVLAS